MVLQVTVSIVMRSALQEQKLHWWCYDLATRPDLQGNGFATALMNIGYQKASSFNTEEKTLTYYFLIPRPKRLKSWEPSLD